MMKRMLTLLVLLVTWTSYGQSSERCLREIARDFFVEKGQMLPGSDFYVSESGCGPFLMYDYLNGTYIEAAEPVPVQDKLSLYTLEMFGICNHAYTVLAKNGVCKIIDWSDDLYGMAKQLFDYDRQAPLTKEELLQALEHILKTRSYSRRNLRAIPPEHPSLHREIIDFVE